MTPPPMLRLVPQRDTHGDCAVSCLATVCEVSYEEALLAAAKVNPSVLSAGLFFREIAAAAKSLGKPMRRVRAGRYDLEESWGILHVLKVKPPEDSHVVVLTGRGDVFDGRDNALWEVDGFMASHGYRPGYLLVRQ